MKRYFAILCALITLAVLPSCGNNQQDISESSDSVSESATEEVTESQTTALKETTTKATTTTAKTTETTTAAKVKNKKFTFGDLSFELPEDCEEDKKSNQVSYTFGDSSLFQIVKEDCSDYDLYHSEDSLKQLTLETFVSAMFNDTLKQSGESETTNINGEFALKQDASMFGYFDTTLYVFVYEDNLYSLCFSSMIGTGAYDAQDEIIKSISFNSNSKSTANKTEATTPESNSSETLGQKNALKSAKSYIDFSSFSYLELIEQLEYEKYSHEEAVYAADNCGADWNAEALESAKSYIDFSGFSYQGLLEQLEYEQFTSEQAQYGVDNCGADWFQEAAECAESYISYSSFSRDELLDQLIYEGFTQEQAEYGVQSVGY